jgi:hypothetical protein
MCLYLVCSPHGPTRPVNIQLINSSICRRAWGKTTSAQTAFPLIGPHASPRPPSHSGSLLTYTPLSRRAWREATSAQTETAARSMHFPPLSVPHPAHAHLPLCPLTTTPLPLGRPLGSLPPCLGSVGIPANSAAGVCELELTKGEQPTPPCCHFYSFLTFTTSLGRHGRRLPRLSRDSRQFGRRCITAGIDLRREADALLLPCLLTASLFPHL